MASIVPDAAYWQTWRCLAGVVDLFVEKRRAFIVLLLRLRLVGISGVRRVSRFRDLGLALGSGLSLLLAMGLA